jgi:putative membrane protein
MTAGKPSIKLPPELIRAMSRSERLALARTLMANQRTVLAYVTTSLGLLAGGYGLIVLTGHMLLQAAGVVGLALSGIVVILGLVRYRRMKRALGGVTASHILDVGYSLLHDEAGLASDDASAPDVSSDR